MAIQTQPPREAGLRRGRTPMRTATLRYSYTNRQPGPTELWLALPPELPTQAISGLEFLAAQPEQIVADACGINRLAYFRLEPGQTVSLLLQAELHRPRGPAPAAPLSPDERRFYTRSSPLISVDAEVLAEAQQIVGGATEPREQARRLSMHLLRTYRYVWPPEERGSSSARRSGAGDCGEFAFVLAAWCRALGIPCRVLFGSWARGQSAAHAWNEVYIEGAGWLPVDASVFQPSLRIWPLNELDWLLQGARTHLGRIGGDRIAFSIDPDVQLVPAFRDAPPPPDVFQLRAGGRELSWGYTSLDGAAPYLQPAYPRFSAGRPNSLDQLLGSWSCDPDPRDRLALGLLAAGYLIGLVGLALSLAGVAGAALPQALGWVLGNAMLIRITGMHLWKLAILLLFVVEAARAFAGLLSG